ncbi:MAG: CYTH domain-containing protein [Muribaculaceae bacterium]|nr:CYTH domain-containing protein [Muribaculaceae bacterium]
MGLEIEHKYLVKEESYKEMAIKRIQITQGYLNRDPHRVVRIRIADDDAFLTIKGKNRGDTRLEMEYKIPKEDALKLLEICDGGILRKVRHIIKFEGETWEVDEFLSLSSPLTIAEIEIPDSNHKYKLPPFAGKNVTGQPQYYNSNLESV